MPIRVTDEQGNTHIFPDGSTPEMIAKALHVKYSPAFTAPTSMGTIRPLTERERFTDVDLYPVGMPGEGIGENLKNIAQRGGVGIFQLADAVVNPRRTAAGLLSSVLPEPVIEAQNRAVDWMNRVPGMHYLTTKMPQGTENPLQSAYQAAVTSRGPMELAGKMAPIAGQALAGDVAATMLGPITSDLMNTASRAREGATENFGSSPKTVRDLVKQVKKKNTIIEKFNAEFPEKQKTYQQELDIREAANKAMIAKYEQDVKETEEKNGRAAREHAQAVQVVDSENAAKMDKYRNDVEAVRAENVKNQEEYEAAKKKAENLKVAAKQQETFKGRLARQVQENGQRLINRIREVQAKWKDSSALQRTKDYKPVGILDRGYDQVRKATASESVPGGDLVSAVRAAEEKIAGSTENIKQFRDILSKGSEDSPEFIESSSEGKIPKGHALYDVLLKLSNEGKSESFSFKDLQGYYSEIGEKLAQGHLAPDVYQAFQSLHRSIGAMMQGMADNAGVGSLLRRLQAQYADYMQTFREPSGPNHSGSPIAMALEAKDPLYAVEPLMRDETASRVRNALVRFDQQQGGAAGIYDNLRSANRAFDRVEAIKVPKEPSVPTAKPEPEAPSLKPRPTEPPVKPSPEYPTLAEKPIPPKPPKPLRKVGEKEIREAKSENLDKAVSMAQRRIFWWSTVWPAFRSISDVARGEMPGLGTFTPMAGGVMVNMALDRLFQKPGVIDFFTRATPKDIAQVPEDIRGDLPQIVKAAQSRGIEISPALAKLIGAPATLRGLKTQQLQKTADDARNATASQ